MTEESNQNERNENFQTDLRVLPQKNSLNSIPQNEAPENTPGLFMEVFKFTIVAILIVAPIRIFIAQPFIVKGESMDPTFADGQYLIVDELTYRTHEPERGDVIVFKYPKDPSKYFIKRVIGLPNETIKIDSGKITIFGEQYPGGHLLNEEYIKNVSFDTLTEKLGSGEYFAMGDNRTNSLDSRVWGPLPKEDIVGRVLVRLFPLQEAGLFPGKHDQ
ncbi:MAG: signal peptidase I [Parcubacteria group bacterium]|nr:signal peptidase I [Parcubacteria group bacterium]